MSLRTRILVGLACLSVAAAIGLFFWSDKEPQYKGRTVTEWTYVYAAARLDGDQLGAQEAEYAIKQIGTNGIPAILACISQEKGRSQEPSFMTKIPLMGDWILDARQKREDKAFAAENFFHLLGSQCTSAIPQLSRIVDTSTDVDVRHRAITSLLSIGDEALPIFARFIGEPEHPARLLAVGLLSIRFYSKGLTNGVHLIPHLSSLSTNANTQVAAKAVRALAILAPNPQIAVSIALNAFQSTNEQMRVAAVYAFGDLGQKQYVERALSAPETRVRETATNTLRMMDEKTENE
ncbi:MAG: hypothetical protein H0X66_00680 [Verrucomicrobia bacterium]|nr:hypothetical protein [Verrucomicrobiota bacterium]